MRHVNSTLCKIAHDWSNVWWNAAGGLICAGSQRACGICTAAGASFARHWPRSGGLHEKGLIYKCRLWSPQPVRPFPIKRIRNNTYHFWFMGQIEAIWWQVDHYWQVLSTVLYICMVWYLKCDSIAPAFPPRLMISCRHIMCSHIGRKP